MQKRKLGKSGLEVSALGPSLGRVARGYVLLTKTLRWARGQHPARAQRPTRRQPDDLRAERQAIHRRRDRGSNLPAELIALCLP